MSYLITKTIEMAILMEVDADSVEEAIEMVDDAWADNETFVKNVVMTADIEDSATFDNAVQDPSCYNVAVRSFDEMCKRELF